MLIEVDPLTHVNVSAGFYIYMREETPWIFSTFLFGLYDFSIIFAGKTNYDEKLVNIHIILVELYPLCSSAGVQCRSL